MTYRTRKHKFEYELGGLEIEWTLAVNPGSPATLTDPEDPPETIVESAQLFIGLGPDKRPQYLDILPILEDANGGELPEWLLDHLQEKIDYEGDEE